MNQSRWNRMKEIFGAAEALPGTDRLAYLDVECADDEELRREVETLLSADAGPEFLAPPERDEIDAVLGFDDRELSAGARLGPYELVSLIASGGMGSVYLARRADDVFDKQVAIKVMQRSVAGPHLEDRFQRERQALARLDHPNVTRLLDGGTTPDGRPYLVMEYVEGRPIDLYCHDMRATIAQRLELFTTVCAAVAYAHRNLVIHRDVKPSNVLVADDGTVKLLDFGIARWLDHEDGTAVTATITRLRAMTPEYASPEQIRGEPVSTATDVYSLGVLLYELLCGRRPFRLRDLPHYEADRTVCEEDPPLPSSAVGRGRRAGAIRLPFADRAGRALRGDLDTIVMTALRKDPARRYGSVEQFADDVRRYLDSRPIRARKDTFVYRAGKLMRRNKPLTAAGLLVAAAVCTAFVGISLGLVHAREAERTARFQRASAQEVVAFFEKMLTAANPYRKGHEVTVLELLEDAERDIGADLADKPEVEAGVRLALARTQVSMMMWDRVRPNAERALALYRRLGEDERDDLLVAECLGLLGRAYSHLDVPRAVDVQRESLAIRRRILGPEHPLVAEATGNLGFALWQNGPRPPRFDDAETRYLEALAMLDRLGHGRTRDAARYTMSLGYMYHRQGRPVEAEARYREALSLYAELPVNEDLYEFAALSCYAELLEDLERYGEAARLVTEYRAMLPSGDDEKLRTMTWRSARLRRLGNDLDAALRDYREALALECEAIETVTPGEAERLRGYATLLRSREPGMGPAALFHDVVDVLRSATAGSGVHVARQMQELAIALRAIGENAAAVAMLETCAEASRASLPESEATLRSAEARLQAWSRE